jgi:Zn-dependent protease
MEHMFRRQFSKRLKFGRVLGIDLYVHWTFWLLFFGVGIATLLSPPVDATAELTEQLSTRQAIPTWQDWAAWQAAGMSMLQIAALFLCVTLHEYGHAIMARQFGIRTIDITLLPIGGLARLERMPREPWQELLVAVAGPAVNVVIAGIVFVAMFFSLPVLKSDWDITIPQVLQDSALGWLLGINVMLVVFNMIPAFPMDGGRVLRAFLAMLLDYRTATRVAARIGILAAVMMAFIGFQFPDFRMLIFVAAFIGYAGWAESRQVEMSEALRGIRIEEGMIAHTFSVNAMQPLDELVTIFQRRTERVLPVLGVETFYLGMLDIDAVLQAARQNRWLLTASDLMHRNWPILQAPGPLDQQLIRMPPNGIQVLPVLDSRGRLMGLFDFEQMEERVNLYRVSQKYALDNDLPIDAVLVQESPRIVARQSGEYNDTYL